MGLDTPSSELIDNLALIPGKSAGMLLEIGRDEAGYRRLGGGCKFCVWDSELYESHAKWVLVEA